MLKNSFGVLLSVLLSFAIGVKAQSTGSIGNNAVYSGSSGTNPAASLAYIDAYPISLLAVNNGDICLTINYILTSTAFNYTGTYPYGAVIDARGILPASGTGSVSCSVNPFWNYNTSTYVSVPSTILLPGTNINVTTTWTLPSSTRIIGEGSGPQNYTALGVFNGLGANNTAMIQMGTGSSPQATGVVIEHMQLNGNYKGNFDGIDNLSAGDASYVNDVEIMNIGAISSGGSVKGACSPNGGAVTSLCISPGATYSGPYTNLNVVPTATADTTTCAPNMCLSTACVKIQAQTRGLHGLSCVGASTQSGPWPSAAIYLDSYSTTIENVHVEGFQDAIVVGDYADGQGNLSDSNSISGISIANVVGSSSTGAPLRNTVHICNSGWGYTFTGACTKSASTKPVNNLTIVQATVNSSVSDAQPVQDDNVTWQEYTDSEAAGILYAGLYAVGCPVGGCSTAGEYARFTTMPGNASVTPTPTWAAGQAAITGSCTNSGALFSNTKGVFGSKNTVYVCSANKTGSLEWTAIGN